MIIFNEREFALSLTNNLPKKAYTLQEMTIYAKWLRTNIFTKKSDAEVVPLLYSTLSNFLHLCWSDFDPDVEYQRLNKAIKTALNQPLRTAHPIIITPQELSTINSLPSTPAKILFTMLVISKFNRANPIIDTSKPPTQYSDTRLRNTTPLSELFKIAHIRYSKDPSTYSIFNHYTNLIDLVPSKHLSRILLFADPTNITPSPTMPPNSLIISDYSNLILYYEQQTNPHIKSCTHCTHLFKDTSKRNNQLLCPTCRNPKPPTTLCTECGIRIPPPAHGPTPLRCPNCQKAYRRQYKKDFNAKS